MSNVFEGSLLNGSSQPLLYSVVYFGIYADFEAHSEIITYQTGNTTSNIFKQNPVFNAYFTKFESDDVLKSGYYETPLEYNDIGWFFEKILKIENKMAFYFEKTKKHFIMGEEDEKFYKDNNICRFCEKE